MGGFTISEATAQDLPVLLEMTRATHAEHVRLVPGHFAEDAVPMSASMIEDALSSRPNARRRILVARDAASRVAGYVGLQWYRSAHGPERHNVLADVFDIAVRPDLRGQGVGTALLAEARRQLEAEGATRVGATVWEGNAVSERLFRTAGFAPSARIWDLGLSVPKVGGLTPAKRPRQGIGWVVAAMLLLTVLILIDLGT